MPSLAGARSSWPATGSNAPERELTEYVTHLIDRQSRSFRGQDYFYRRFESVKTGRLVV
jgi:hypothetical protein